MAANRAERRGEPEDQREEMGKLTQEADEQRRRFDPFDLVRPEFSEPTPRLRLADTRGPATKAREGIFDAELMDAHAVNLASDARVTKRLCVLAQINEVHAVPLQRVCPVTIKLRSEAALLTSESCLPAIRANEEEMVQPPSTSTHFRRSSSSCSGTVRMRGPGRAAHELRG
jgi:hypothetical protein